MSSSPNLFNYATKELSQDAFICWLLDWANDTNLSVDADLHQAARIFLRAMLAKHDVDLRDDPLAIKIGRQLSGIDIAADVNGKYLLLIEDKTHTSEHSDQLRRYIEAARQKYPDRLILPTYVKTGDQSRYDAVEKAGYRLFLRPDVLSALKAGKDRGTDNAIFNDFLSYLSAWNDIVGAYLHQPVNDWIENHESWIGFYEVLQQSHDGLEWGYVANQAGGFFGAWWGFWTWRDFEVYLQIEQGNLCFKLGVPDRMDGRGMRDLWHARLMQGARDLGELHVTRPSRFGIGRTMTAALISRTDWMVQQADGLLDVNSTLSRLATAEKIIELASRSP